MNIPILKKTDNTMVLKGQVLEKFFSISGGIFFIFRETFFLFLGKYFLFLGKYFYFLVNIFISRETIVISRDMFLFVAKRYSVSRETVFISCGACGFGRSFWRYVD